MFKPLAFDFPDDAMAEQVEDQLLLGNELMIAPIYKQNAQGRYVYLPEEMMLVRMHSSKDYTTEILPKGHHYVSVGLDELGFFIRLQNPLKTRRKQTTTPFSFWVMKAVLMNCIQIMALLQIRKIASPSKHYPNS